jgi:hypothetical protein
LITPARIDGVARPSGVYRTKPSVEEGGQKSPAVRVAAPPLACAACGSAVPPSAPTAAAPNASSAARRLASLASSAGAGEARWCCGCCIARTMVGTQPLGAGGAAAPARIPRQCIVITHTAASGRQRGCGMQGDDDVAR